MSHNSSNLDSSDNWNGRI